MRGFVPTPDKIVDHMVSLLFDGTVVSSSDHLLDPGCGMGAFMQGVLRWSAATGSDTPFITGIEIDSRLAREAVSQFASDAPVSVIEDDFLLSTSSERFDYIIGNPPYVSILGLGKTEKSEYRSLYSAASGRFDLYMLFFERALRVLNPGGRLVFVTPEKFTYVDSASPLRKLLSGYDIRRLELIPENSFGDLTTYPLITVLEKTSSARDTLIVTRTGDEKLVSLPRGYASWAPLLNGAKSSPQLEGRTNGLSSICDRISCGVATGADGVFVFERSELPAEFGRFAWPTVAGRDLDISQEQVRTRSVMLAPYDVSGSLMPLAELGPFGQYLTTPQIADRLLSRTCAKRKPWYAFHETPQMDQILRPKILCKDIARHPAFWIDRSGATVPRHSTYYIVPTDESMLDSLCEYLNGKEAQDWLVENCQRAANGFIRTQSNVLKRLPIPDEFVPNNLHLRSRQPIACDTNSKSAILEKIA